MLSKKKWRSKGRHFFLVFILGFSSGLPFALVSTTLAAWFSVHDLSVITISYLALLTQPYSFKFLWAPLFDRAFLRYWLSKKYIILACQAMIAGLLLLFVLLTPTKNALSIGGIALLIACISATQDIAIDAYRTELLLADELGLGATIAILSYRLATLCSGAVALLVADNFGWESAFYYLCVLVLLPMPLVALYYEAPLVPSPISTQGISFIATFQSLLAKPKAMAVLLFVFLFKLAEAFTSTSSPLIMPFLLNKLEFTLSTVAYLNKGVGIIATLLGSVVGGVVINYIPLYQALMGFAFCQFITNGLFVLLAAIGKNGVVLAITVFSDNFAAGMGMAGLLAFMMAYCDKRFAASQFALLTAISAMPRLIAGLAGGLLQEHLGWLNLFIVAFILALPAMIGLKVIKSEVTRYE